MPEAAKGPRLWLRREPRDKSGAITHKPCGSSGTTADTSKALDAALTIVNGLSNGSRSNARSCFMCGILLDGNPKAGTIPR